jgi:hypothetical protein
MLHLLKIAQTVIKTPTDIFTEFQVYNNMSAGELEKWFKSETLKTLANANSNLDFAIDKKLTQKIIKILLKKKFRLTKGDFTCLEKVNNLIASIYLKKPAGDLTHSDWRNALMHLGHDPLKITEN